VWVRYPDLSRVAGLVGSAGAREIYILQTYRSAVLFYGI
jgi:hypothetical protein